MILDLTINRKIRIAPIDKRYNIKNIKNILKFLRNINFLSFLQIYQSYRFYLRSRFHNIVGDGIDEEQ